MILLALIIIVLRVWFATNTPPESFTWFQAYKDFAHIFMGCLLVNLKDKKTRIVFILLCVVEILVATLSRI